jgi:hypothetical protein
VSEYLSFTIVADVSNDGWFLLVQWLKIYWNDGDIPGEVLAKVVLWELKIMHFF